jgi:hypothetical protein
MIDVTQRNSFSTTTFPKLKFNAIDSSFFNDNR